jgi:TRAP transporter TAXI family solute receptor
MHKFMIAAALLLGLGATGAQAVEASIMTGKPTGTYIRFGQDIAGVARHFGLDLAVATSAGSLENIEAVIKRPNTQFGIVQSDVLDFIATFSDDPDLHTTAKLLRMVFPLYNEEVHLVARQGVESLADLEDRRVAVGASNSGTLLTANLMLATAGVEPAQEVEIDPDEALSALRDGRVDAFFYVAGRPARLFAQEVTEADGVHLVPITDPSVLSIYGRSVIPAGTYRWQKAEVSTVAVRAILMTYDFARPTRYQREACAVVGKVARMIASNLDWLREVGRGHPKWQEVDVGAEIVSWKRSACAEAGLKAPQDYKIAAQPAAFADCAAEPNGIRRRLCQVRQQMRQHLSTEPSAKLM